MTDPLLDGDDTPGDARPRRHFILDDTGFDEVPKKYRRFYRKWGGPGDMLAPNEVLGPVCKVVIRSIREPRPGGSYLLHAMHVSTGGDARRGRLARGARRLLTRPI